MNGIVAFFQQHGLAMNHEQAMALIQQHEDFFYLVTFVWTALEGETFVIFAGLAAQRELLNVYLLFIAAALGSMFGDQVMFFLGRRYGRRIVHRYPKLQPKLEKIFRILEKYDVSFIMSYRFMYGVRNISALSIGMSQIAWRRFTALNAIASFVWSFVFCGVGYLFGDIMERVGFGNEETMNFEVRNFMLAALGLFVLMVGLRVWYAKRQAAKEREAEVLSQPKGE
ncbi:MAG: DedA family protein [Alphaproteobacteria bacterium]|nr:DedA family protein [Alphaproteobacteria bacterium]